MTMPKALLELFRRYNEIALLLPDDVEGEDDAATARVVLKELAAIQAQIDKFLTGHSGAAA
jgi:hypothetical protein